MIPKIIDWRITSNCNCNCRYCYASKKVDRLSLEDEQIVINKIVASGCEFVCISGGEPLLEPERAKSIIQTLHEKGISVFLSTNGTNYLKNIDGIGGNLSKLSLPLDGYDKESTELNGRAGGDFDTVIQILNYYKNFDGKKPDIKVSTVLTRNNINDIQYFQKIFEILKEYPIKLWKIYDFIPENRGAENQKDLNYTNEEFEIFKKEIANAFPNIKDFRIEVVGRDSRSLVYFIIQPDGTVIVPQDKNNFTEEIYVGDLKTTSIKDILNNWNNVIDKSRCVAHCERRNIKSPLNVLEITNFQMQLLTELLKKPLYKKKELASIFNVSEQKIKNEISFLKSSGTIREIIPIINISVLGLWVYLANLKFKLDGRFTSDGIANVICAHRSVAWCAEYKDLRLDERKEFEVVFRISIFAKDPYEATNVIDELINAFGASTIVSYNLDYVPEKSILYDTLLVKDEHFMDGTHIVYKEKTKRISKDEYRVLSAMKDFRMTKDLSFDTLLQKLQDSRWGGASAAKKLDNIVDRLRGYEIINKFQLVLDDHTLGYQTYLLLYKLHPSEKQSRLDLIEEFEKYVRSLGCVTHINRLTTGNWDLDIEIQVKSTGDFSSAFEKITAKFDRKITNCQELRLIKEYKFTFLIPVVDEIMKKLIK